MELFSNYLNKKKGKEENMEQQEDSELNVSDNSSSISKENKDEVDVEISIAEGDNNRNKSNAETLNNSSNIDDKIKLSKATKLATFKLYYYRCNSFWIYSSLGVVGLVQAIIIGQNI